MKLRQMLESLRRLQPDRLERHLYVQVGEQILSIAQPFVVGPNHPDPKLKEGDWILKTE